MNQPVQQKQQQDNQWGNDDFEFEDFVEAKPEVKKQEPKVKADKMEMFSE